MGGLRYAALRLCISGILAGILQEILPRSIRSGGIKLVFGLYIMVSVFGPIQSVSRQEFAALIREPPASAAATGLSAQVCELAALQLRKQLQQTLNAERCGAEVVQVSVAYAPETGAAEAENVSLRAEEPARSAAKQAVYRLLGEVEVTFLEQDD